MQIDHYQGNIESFDSIQTAVSFLEVVKVAKLWNYEVVKIIER